MPVRPFAVAFIALSASLGGAPHAAALSLAIDYSVSVRGFPVGRAHIRAETIEDRYAIAFSAGITGLARLFAKISTTAEANGTLGADRPYAAEYTHTWTEDGETETAALQFAEAGVQSITLEPPIDRPERYVPMTEAHRDNAVDPVSAFLWPAPTGATGDACARTLPLIDGKRRFDIEAAFARMDSFSVRRGSRFYRAVVCTIRYRAIAGHRADRPEESGGPISEGGGMEVWLADIGDGLVAPIKVQLMSRIGRVVMQATRFDVE